LAGWDKVGHYWNLALGNAATRKKKEKKVRKNA